MERTQSSLTCKEAKLYYNISSESCQLYEN